jgi:hypothetical protein
MNHDSHMWDFGCKDFGFKKTKPTYFSKAIAIDRPPTKLLLVYDIIVPLQALVGRIYSSFLLSAI